MRNDCTLFLWQRGVRIWPEKAPSSAGLAPQNQVQWEQKFTKEKGRPTMTYTSAQANKLLKKLNDEHAALLDKENRSKDFRAAMGEDVESVRPAYDYTDTQKKLAELEQRIRKVKHAINTVPILCAYIVEDYSCVFLFYLKLFHPII